MSTFLRYFLKSPRDNFPRAYKFLASGKIICRSCRAELEPIGTPEEKPDCTIYKCQHGLDCKILWTLSTEPTTGASANLNLPKLHKAVAKLLPKLSFVLLFIPQDRTPLSISQIYELPDFHRLQDAFAIFEDEEKKKLNYDTNFEEDLQPTL